MADVLLYVPGGIAGICWIFVELPVLFQDHMQVLKQSNHTHTHIIYDMYCIYIDIYSVYTTTGPSYCVFVDVMICVVVVVVVVVVISGYVGKKDTFH